MEKAQAHLFRGYYPLDAAASSAAGGLTMSENNPNYGTIQCKSKFIRLTADEEKACKGRNSFPSVNENKWVNKFIKDGEK